MFWKAKKEKEKDNSFGDYVFNRPNKKTYQEYRKGKADVELRTVDGGVYSVPVFGRGLKVIDPEELLYENGIEEVYLDFRRSYDFKVADHHYIPQSAIVSIKLTNLDESYFEITQTVTLPKETM